MTDTAPPASSSSAAAATAVTENKCPPSTQFDTSGATQPIWKQAKGSTNTELSTIGEPCLSNDITTEICIIGGGIAGLSLAYELLLSGKSMILIEDGPSLVSGETSRTTAHIMPALDDRWYQLKSMHGIEYSQLIKQSQIRASQRIEEIIKKENILCEYRHVNGYLIHGEDRCSSLWSGSLLEKEFDAARECGWTENELEVVDIAPLPDIAHFDSGFALKFNNQAEFNPISYCEGLAKAIIRMNGKIYRNSHAEEIKGGSDAYVKVKGGHKIHCKTIAVCTNVPINNYVHLIDKMMPYRTYVVAANVPKGSVARALFWDLAEPYHYVRLVELADNDEYDSLIVGGEDHRVGTQTDDDQKARFQRLEEWTRKRFPVVKEFTHHWSGQVQEPVDLIPFIGHNPHDADNVFTCVGDSGTGMTNMVVGSLLLHDLILNKPNGWEKVYEPSRKRIKAATQFIESAMEQGAGYIGWIKGSDIEDIDKLPCGKGAVFKEGLRGIVSPTCVYRDESNRVHRFSAICTHLHAIVRWNDQEKTFDCPAHGSRFDRFGHVINGPANEDLKPVNAWIPSTLDMITKKISDIGIGSRRSSSASAPASTDELSNTAASSSSSTYQSTPPTPTPTPTPAASTEKSSTKQNDNEKPPNTPSMTIGNIGYI